MNERPGVTPKSTVTLLMRDGLFYARLHCSGEPFEIALHGIASEEQAHAAVEAIAPSTACEDLCS